MKEMQLRQIATQATIDQFKGKPFTLGQYDCFQIAKEQTARLGFNWTMINLRTYDTALGAKRTLQQLGVETLPELMDKFFRPLHSPAFARIGDLLSFPTADDPLGIGGLVLYCGNQMILSYHEATDEAVQARILEPATRGWSAL